jgi:hypothetical protein
MQKSEYRKYTNRCSYPIEKIIKFENDYQRRERIDFSKSKENRQNVDATQRILY